MGNQKRKQKETTCYCYPPGIKILTQPWQRRSHQQVWNNGVKTYIKSILAPLNSQTNFWTFRYVFLIHPSLWSNWSKKYWISNPTSERFRLHCVKKKRDLSRNATKGQRSHSCSFAIKKARFTTSFMARSITPFNGSVGHWLIF